MTQRIYQYQIDTEGRLWHDGSEITDPQVLKLFMRTMVRMPDGRFRVLCMGEINYIKAEDVPYVIQDIQLKSSEVKLFFMGSYSENLDPNTLFVGKKNVLYCKVRKGQFMARFNRKSYWELTHFVEEVGGKYYLRLGKSQYEIQSSEFKL